MRLSGLLEALNGRWLAAPNQDWRLKSLHVGTTAGVAGEWCAERNGDFVRERDRSCISASAWTLQDLSQWNPPRPMG